MFISTASCSSAAGPARCATSRCSCDRREQERLSGDSRHLRGGEGGQEWLERVPQASQGTRVEGRPAHHLGCLHWACRERRRVLSGGCLAKGRRALVPHT